MNHGAKATKKNGFEGFLQANLTMESTNGESKTHRRNFGATIPMRFASRHLRKTMELRAQQQH